MSEDYKYEMFQNRLVKVYRHLSKTARRQTISCYRIYDHDLPEFPFSIDIYENKLYLVEYQRKHNLSDYEHEGWLQQCKAVTAEVLNIPIENIYTKTRRRKPGRQGQYQK